ncbi:trypsin-like peptidase domain-containing protein [Pseudanabaena sp. FACHB-2040]|uniref:S1C family serine protease n=1 Tax=Pseudanabaena sp. FACHB-2040 TaxID=2692859 RepID=UPI00168342B6|nr:trypsin-like peptidase domain-containing protein [Pseudanabaena sp. FACHB-2040]MBD2256357.1 trypsin-like peptidase domain-containing protein [Pseudanabaena sp. FACHB-2040]
MSFAENANPLQGFSEGLADALDQVSNSIVAVQGRRRFACSGVYWQPGVIVTADYVLKRESALTVVLPSGEAVSAELVGRDPALDLVVLRVEGVDLPVPQRSDPTQLRVGQLAIAAGRSLETGLSASLGILSNLGGAWRTMQGRAIDRFIRPDVTLYPSLLGGALVDTQGHIIGINLSGPRNWPITIPAETLDRVVGTLLQSGQIPRGYLGIGLQPVVLPPGLQESLNLTDEVGVLVVSLEPDSPADQAGIFIGDILLSLGDQPVANLQDVQAALDADTVGQSLQAQIVRGGQLIEATLVVGERPQRGRC